MKMEIDILHDIHQGSYLLIAKCMSRIWNRSVKNCSLYCIIQEETNGPSYGQAM